MRKLLAMFGLMIFAVFAFAQTPQQLQYPQLAGGGGTSYIPLPPSYTDACYFSVAGTCTFTLPSSAIRVAFSSTCNFYAKGNATAAVPGASVTDGSASTLNPYTWHVQGMSSIGVAVGGACVITLSSWR